MVIFNAAQTERSLEEKVKQITGNSIAPNKREPTSPVASQPSTGVAREVANLKGQITSLTSQIQELRSWVQGLLLVIFLAGASPFVYFAYFSDRYR